MRAFKAFSAFSPSLAFSLAVILSARNSGVMAHGGHGVSKIAEGEWVSPDPIVGFSCSQMDDKCEGIAEGGQQVESS